jgi:hypothetical protein
LLNIPYSGIVVKEKDAWKGDRTLFPLPFHGRKDLAL